MTLFRAVVLALVQGLTEFIPVSSSAHLVLVPAALGWPLPSVEFDALLHAGSLVAVLVYFRRELLQLIREVWHPGAERRLAGLLVIGTIPAAFVGFFFEDQISVAFERPRLTAALLIGTAAVLAAAELYVRRPQHSEEKRAGSYVGRIAVALSWSGAAFVGASQAAAILPGLSRSGLTIGAGLFAGLDRSQAARFSFLLSIPALAGASLLEIPKLWGSSIAFTPLAAGFAVSAATSYLAVAGMIGYLERSGLYPFAGYCLGIGLLGVWLFT